jgi:hypothetical protein
MKFYVMRVTQGVSTQHGRMMRKAHSAISLAMKLQSQGEDVRVEAYNGHRLGAIWPAAKAGRLH